MNKVISFTSKFGIFFGITLGVIIFSYVFIKQTSFSQVYDFLNNRYTNVSKAIVYQDGKFDTSLYNSSPYTAFPNTSSDFPQYVITIDGYVIERSSPVNDYLDTSDYKHYQNFSTPQTVEALSNEKWRLLSKEVLVDGKVVGVIVVGSFDPQPEILGETDQKLSTTLNQIETMLKTDQGTIDISNVDVKTLDYNISFEVIDNYNKVLINKGRTPSYIDVSYVNDALHTTGFFTKQDGKTGETFLMLAKPILDKDGNTIGIISIGKSIEANNNSLNSYLIYSLSLGFVLSAVFALVGTLLNKEAEIISQKEVKTISFDKKASKILLDDLAIEIPYASYQYYLCKAVFSSPSKRWEYDELLAKLGEDKLESNPRKVYDAVLAINRKTNTHLIVYKDKTFAFNPELISKIV